MGLATARRLALVAAFVMLTVAWGPPVTGAAATGVRRPDAVVTRPAAAAAPGPAIRRHANPGARFHAWRLGGGRALLAMAVMALLALLRLAPWATPASVSAAASSLAERRHAISLRAPPSVVGA